MEASDWPTLITTGAARDYAEQRFGEHAGCLRTLLDVWSHFLSNGAIDADAETVLFAAEQRDGIFPGIDPADWRDRTA